MAILIALVLGILSSIIAVEMYSIMPAITDWLLRIATRRLAGAVRDRCFEEWRAQLATIPSPLFRLIHALSLIFRAGTVLREDIDDYFRDFDAAVETFTAATKKSRVETGMLVANARAAFAVARIRFAMIRMVIIVAMFRSREPSSSEKFVGVRGFLANYASRRRTMLQFQKAVMDGYKVIDGKEAKITSALREARAKRSTAVATLARCEDYDTRAPAIAADLRRKLAAEIDQARLTKAASDQLRENIAVAHAALKNAGSLGNSAANKS